MVLMDLGERASGEQGAQYLEQSVAAYRNLLRVLGERANGEQGAQYLKQSVEAIENALGIFTPEAAPYQNSLARADLERAKAALRKISSH
jgi:Ni,Fe-hydrogenase III large subunit